jgi:putative cell wall-binding protein
MLIHKLRNNTIKKYKKAFKYPFSFILKNKFENYDIRKITRIMFDTKIYTYSKFY